MNYFRVIFFVFWCSLLNGQENPGDLHCKSIPELEQQAWLNRQAGTSGVPNNYNLIYHRCYWEVDPAVKYIAGSVTTYFKPRESGFSQIQFDLKSNMTVDSVIYHDAKVSYTKQAGDILQISFPSAVPQNTLDSLCIYYRGEPDTDGLGSFVKSDHAGAPIIWTLSEPFGAKTWWPCKQALVDKIDSIDIIVRTPTGNRVGSNGLLISETTDGSDVIFHWRSRYPIAAYLVAIAVTNYAQYSDYVPLQTRTLQVLNYVYPERLATSQAESKDIIPIIHLFDSLLIEYPFAKEKYGHAQFSWGGGMEHQTMSFMEGFSRQLMAHEVAHQWFGDHITCGSWEDIWLNEGFASYFEWMITERFAPEGWRTGLPGIIRQITSLPGGSVRCDDTTQAGRILDGRLTYSKGAFLLRMLHFKIGNQAFYTALKNYLSDPKLKGGYAKTPQLIQHFEAASGQDLTRFFDQWYYGQGYPTYRLLWTQVASEVSFTLTQTNSHPSVTFFEMPVEIRFAGLHNDTTIRFEHTYSGQTMSLKLDYEVSRVFLDPGMRMISGRNSVIGIKDLNSENLSLYPNPASDHIRIFGIPRGAEVQRVSITDLFGHTLRDYKTQFVIEDDLQVPVDALPEGVYILTLNTDLGRVHLRFAKD